MKELNSRLAIGGKFYVKHYRDGKLLDSDESCNIFVDDGLVYALNVALGQSVGGTPALIPTFYIGLSRANRTWQSTDNAATINSVANEMELYDELTRPAWTPSTLAVPGAIEITDTGVEAEFTVSDLSGGTETIYGAFLISTSAKDGASDGSATLIAGSNFSNTKVLSTADSFKVGYVLKAQAV